MAKQIQCCPINQIFWDPTGRFNPVAPPEPPAPFHIYSAQLPMSGNPMDDIVAGLFSQGIPQNDGANLASFLQVNITGDSGASMLVGDTDYMIWIRAQSIPLGWTWNGNPIDFTDEGELTLRCFDTGEFPFIADPDPANWTPLSLIVFGYSPTIQGLSPSYTDAGFPAVWASIATQIGGVNAIGGFVDNNPRIQMTVTSSYATWVQITSDGGVSGTQDNPFNLIACP